MNCELNRTKIMGKTTPWVILAYDHHLFCTTDRSYMLRAEYEYNYGFLSFSSRFFRSLPCLSLLAPAHSRSLLHMLMHEYLGENDKSPIMGKTTPWVIAVCDHHLFCTADRSCMLVCHSCWFAVPVSHVNQCNSRVSLTFSSTVTLDNTSF